MTNEQMIKGRFLRWHKARRRIVAIKASLEAGRTVQLTTCTRAVRYNAKHIEMFKATKNGAFVQRGRFWDCIDGVKINVFA